MTQLKTCSNCKYAHKLNFRDDVFLTKESEDMCYDEEYQEDGCDLRSNFTKDCNLVVVLEAGKHYLYSY